MSDWQKRYLGWDHFPARLEKVEIDVFFTLAEAEYAAVVRHRKPPNRLGIAIQIGYMRMTGMALNSVELIPSVVLSHVAGQLGQQPPQLASIRALYRRRRTLHEHQEAARAVLGLRVLTEHARRQLKVHLRKIVPSRIGMSELVREARGWLAHNRYQQVGERGLLDLAREVRGGFEAEIREQLIKAAGDGLPGRWAKELASEHAPRVSRLEWLRSGPRSKRPRGLADHLAKLRFLKEMGADRLDFGLSEAALRALAMPLRHRKAASLKGPGDIDHLAIACFLRLRLLELNDTAVMLVLHRTTDLWRQARERAEQRQAGLWRQLRHLPYRLAVLGGDSALPDGSFREMTLELVQPFVAREGSVPTAQPGTRVALIREELASQNGPSAELLTALEEIGVEASGNSALCTALAGLKENAPRTGNPFGATWQGLIGQADRQRALGAWRAATLLLFKRALRNGQAHCPASLRHRAIEEQLIPAATWARDKGVLIRLLALPPGPERALAGLRDSLDQGLALLNQAVAKGEVRIEDDHFVIPKISPDNEDAATRVTRRQLFERIGHTQLTDVVVEADAATGFSRAALGRAPRSEAELITFYAALMALGTDLSAADLARMVPGVSGDAIGTMVRRLEHGKGLKVANAIVLEQFRRLPITSCWGATIWMVNPDLRRWLWFRAPLR